MLNKDILAFISHKFNCDILQPMWHKGPCDCGLYALLDKLRSIGFSSHSRSEDALTLLYQLYKTDKDLVEDWLKSNNNRLPDEVFWCLKCGRRTAEKQPDYQGWDGYCHCCGPIAQTQVGVLAFTKIEKDYSEKE